MRQTVRALVGGSSVTSQLQRSNEDRSRAGRGAKSSLHGAQSSPRAGLLQLVTTGIWGQTPLSCGAVPCTVGCLAVSLACTMSSGSSPPPPCQVVTTKNASRHCQLSPTPPRFPVENHCLRSVKLGFHVIFFFLLLKKFLLLFNYSCMPFLPIPPPHPSQTHLPPPTPPSPLILTVCPL